MRSAAIRSIENAHDACLGGGVGRCLGHLSLGVQVRAIDSKPEGAEQKNAHCQLVEAGRLAVFTLSPLYGNSQNVITP